MKKQIEQVGTGTVRILLDCAQLVLIILKLFKVIDLSWVKVLIPLWIMLGIAVAFIIYVLIIVKHSRS